MRIHFINSVKGGENMNRISIEKKANCYTVEIDSDYRLHDEEDEVYIYTTKEELTAALPELVEKAHVKWAKESELRKAKENKSTD